MIDKEKKRLRMQEYNKRPEVKQRHKIAIAKYRANNKDKEKLRSQEYRQRQEVKEKHRLKMLEWRKNNPEKALEVSRRNYKKNGDKQNEKLRFRLKNDPEYATKVREREAIYKARGRRAEMQRKRYLAKTEELKDKARIWKQNNHEKVLQYVRQYRKDKLISHEQELRDTLDDRYVIMVLKKQSGYIVKTEQIPKDLIEVKRQSLKLKRILKTQKT